ncbi:hypothetical protein N7507_010482 [Penicillium longicatenatum]|nr:hypothetical protein N7507_010482 [Penicillium longicatenatum]
MLEQLKVKLWSNTEKPSKREYTQTADEKPTKSEEKAQKRFSREHSKRVRAREKALTKAQEKREGVGKFVIRGSGGC